jgi:hypothetical protein
MKYVPCLNQTKSILFRCMVQDCEQSLSGSSDVLGNHCRFLDSNGLCYAYKEAQVWCSRNSQNGLCRSGGEDWAVAPLGTAQAPSRTSWTPISDAMLVGPAAHGAAELRYGCTCLKNCASSPNGLACANEAARDPAQSLNVGLAPGINRAAEGRCACSCGGVSAA